MGGSYPSHVYSMREILNSTPGDGEIDDNIANNYPDWQPPARGRFASGNNAKACPAGYDA